MDIDAPIFDHDVSWITHLRHNIIPSVTFQYKASAHLLRKYTAINLLLSLIIIETYQMDVSHDFYAYGVTYRS